MVNWSSIEKIVPPEDTESAIKRAKAIAYLQSTDWYATRFLETGKEIPDVIKQARVFARQATNQSSQGT
ncbi:hypothetical protein [Pseudomonas synxantha]|uniref:hypothetical protein n=1 Tax=Pseudomonas synxantha TaxID=47883 RepID=UPI00099D90FF|nr:hypothetical protein [Pseudomonas synxantha]OPB09047.1 hypothetical protein BFW89_05250 [Pseudomonas synxantha]